VNEVQNLPLVFESLPDGIILRFQKLDYLNWRRKRIRTLGPPVKSDRTGDANVRSSERESAPKHKSDGIRLPIA
jgi:hypothetical protein